MAKLNITNGPTTDMIFTAARYATTPKWRTPLEFTIKDERVSFDWVNQVTWMGDRSNYLCFVVKLYGHEFRVNDYDTRHRDGEITNTEVGPRAVDLWALLLNRRQKALRRIQGSL